MDDLEITKYAKETEGSTRALGVGEGKRCE